MPGQPAQLRSSDGRITVDVPANAFDRPLELVHRTPSEQRPILRGRGQAEPPDVAGFHRGFGAFHLEATDDQGRRVTKFKTPLTLTIHFTPQQLQALGLSAESLRIFWFDDDQVVDRGKGGVSKGLWVPQLTTVDAEAGSATLQMDHFSAFQLSDGSSPSAAYLPSLQGWQVSSFTGAASFSYPIEIPAGPGGLKPALSLNYSSAATDGPGGMRATAQASWVGKGWSLDTGAVALNKIQVTPYSTVNSYALSFGGQSFTLMRGEALSGIATPDSANPTHWAWRPTDESYIRVRVVQNGVSTPGSSSAPGRGAWDYATALPRYTWQVWTKDGTRYDFAEDLWWMWAKCSSTGAFAQSESNRWLLSSVTDPSGNTITYQYGRSKAYFSSCMGQAGTVDFDVWPTEITWAGGRYKVEFVSTARSFDTNFDWPEYTVGGPVRETRQLLAIKVSSKPNDSWQLVRQYNLGYSDSLRADTRVCTYQGCGPDTGSAKLTLISLQRIANDGTTALPATTFSYETNGGSDYQPAGGWNRLTGMSNGQGGTLSLSYANLVTATGSGLFRNRHRVTSRTESDGRGTSYTWSYSYGPAKVNALGATLDPGLEGDLQTGSTPTSAALYYNVFLDGSLDRDQETYLPQPSWSEFRGHRWVTETDPSGAKTTRTFIQGDAGCVPGAGAQGSHAAIIADSCFQQLLRQEFLKGREERVEQRTSANTLLAETVTSFGLGAVNYGWSPLTGLWNAFSYTSASDETAWEGGSTASTRRTEYYYNLSCDWNAALDLYGRLGCIRELDRGSLIRTTLHAYGASDTPTSYLVDRNLATSVRNSANQYLAQSLRFYDTNNQSFGSIGTQGRLTREIALWNLNTRTLSELTNQQLDGRDTTYSYDAWGNRTTSTTYAGAGWARYTGSAWQVSSPGNGSAARTTTTAYDPLFHAFPTSETNPLGYGEQAGYDYRMGTLTSVTDANAQTTSASYDSFGRFSSLIRPGDSASAPTSWVWYYDWEQPLRLVLGQREDAGQGYYRPTIRFYDGLGHLIQEKAESQEAVQHSVIDYRYDGRGRITQQSQPRYVNAADGTYWSYVSPPSTGVFWSTTSYDALGRPETVTAPDGSLTSHHYGVLSDGLRWHDVTDPNRHRLQQRADALGRLRAVAEVNGNCGSAWPSYSCGGEFTQPWTQAALTSYAYSPLDLLTSVTDAAGNSTQSSYDSLGRKTAMSDPDMGAWSYSYTPEGQLATQRDAKNQSLTFSYDALGRLTGKSEQGEALGFSDSFDSKRSDAWLWSSYQSVPYADGGATVLRSSGTGNSWDSNVTRASYDLSNGSMVRLRFKVNAGDTVAHFSLEAADAPYKRFGVIADGNTLYVQYIPDGLNWQYPKTLLTALASDTWYVLQFSLDDQHGFTVQVAQESNPASSASYSVAMPAGQRWRFHHWIWRNSASLDDYQELRGAVYRYDEPWVPNGRGRMTSMSTASATTRWQYDARGHQVRAEHAVAGLPDLRVFSRSYDSAERLTTLQAPGGDLLTYGYDAAWRQQMVCGALCYVSNASFSALNQPERFPLANGLTQVWSYDLSMARLTQLQVGSLFQRSYSYDRGGNVTGIATPGSTASVSYRYDERDRLTSAQYATPASPVTARAAFWNFDPATGNPWASNGTDLTSVPRYRDYPCAGRAASSCRFQSRTFLTASGVSYESITAYGRFYNFRTSDYALVSTNDLTAVSRYTAAGGPCAGQGAGQCVFDTRAYLPATPPVESITAYGKFWNYHADTGALLVSGNLIDVPRYRDYPCAARPANSTCTFDGRDFATINGVLTERISAYGSYWDFNASTGAFLRSGSLASRYGVMCANVVGSCRLDSLAFLPGSPTTESLSEANSFITPGSLETQSFGYDLSGNLTSKGGLSLSYGSSGSGTGAGPHQARIVNGQAYSYDPNGNLSSGGGRSYSWNAENQPTAISANGVSESYGYDALGARVVRRVNGQETVYLEGLWEETVGVGWQRSVPFNGQLVAMRDQNGAITYLHGDHLGSISLTTNSSGSLTGSQEFDAWGQLRSGGITQTARNYTGQYRDGTGLLYYTARYYDPAIGRFVSADTIVPGSNALTVWPSDSVANGAWSTSGSGPGNPQELNRYTYGLNNPIRNTDPTGHCPMCIGAVAGALIGAGVAYGAQVYSNYQSGMDLGQAMTSNINVAAIATGAVAGAVVGGSLGVASTGAITGYTVGTAVEMGAIGSVTNMVGNAAGQLASSGSVNMTDVAVAGVVGFAVGAAAPVVGAPVGLGAVANTAQYVATQSIKGDAITGTGLALNAASGALAGAIGGATSRVPKALSFDTAERALSRSLNAKDFLRANVTRAGLARGIASGGTSNWNYEQYMRR